MTGLHDIAQYLGMLALDMTGSDVGKRATLADIAREADVAISTVSRALAGSRRVHPSTRERVQEIARQLSYAGPATREPDEGRNSSRSMPVPSVLLIVPDLQNPFYMPIVSGAQRALRAERFSLCIAETEESSDLENRIMTEDAPRHGGVLIGASRLSDRQLIGFGATMPIVTINRQTRSVPSVFIDTPAGVVQALVYLKSLGHTRIAYAQGPPFSWSNERRHRALVAAARADNVSLITLGPFGPTLAAGAGAAAELLTSDATACIAFNDLLAIGIITHLRRLGVAVPDRVSVVGCDDIMDAGLVVPRLTTVTAPRYQAAITASSMLIEMMRGRALQAGRRSAVVLAHLTVRDSAGPVCASGRSQ